MFGPFATAQSQARANASNWLELAEKIRRYRRDALRASELAELESRMAGLQGSLRDRADAAKLKLGVEALEATLRKVGGTHYPKSEMVEWVEFLLVAAIVILGIRTYFIQPFQIPTNSMWPSYHGMTAQIYASPTEEPGLAHEALRFVTTGARPRRLDAPVSGEVLIPFFGNPSGPDGQHGYTHFQLVDGRSWLVIPARFREQAIAIDPGGGQPLAFVTVRVPLDFDFDWVAFEAFLAPGSPYSPSALADEIRSRPQTQITIGGQAVTLVHTGRSVRSGERLLSFDILAGDMLMVDRLSYHFVPPEVGDGFVFRTTNLATLRGPLAETYYIKRLVGTPGDILEVREPAVYRNGAPIAGADAFVKNAAKEDSYQGYFNGDPANGAQYLFKGDTLTVPPRDYFAMGDNSGNSEDGRYWGFVPEQNVVGRPLFIYYPLTRIQVAR